MSVILTVMIASGAGVYKETYHFNDMDSCMRMAEVVAKVNPTTNVTNWGTSITSQTNTIPYLAIPVCSEINPPFSADLDGDGVITPADQTEFLRQYEGETK